MLRERILTYSVLQGKEGHGEESMNTSGQPVAPTCSPEALFVAHGFLLKLAIGICSPSTLLVR